MRLYLSLLNRKKRKSILLLVILVLITCALLELNVTYMSIQRNGNRLLKWRHQYIDIINYSDRIVVNRSDILTNNQTYSRTGKSEFSPIRLSEKRNLSVLHSKTETLNKGNEIKLQKKDQTTHYDDSKVVFFLGGGKSGSTTLATYLKHNPQNWSVWDRNGQFMDGGKELCWSKKPQSKEKFWDQFMTHGSKTAVFALDACPQATERVHFERMVKAFPNASYLMLVRDPVDRVISHMNDMLDGKGKPVARNRSIETLIKGSVSKNSLATRLSMFGKILQSAYSVLPRNKILIVPTQDMKDYPQETIDRIMKHIGAKPKNVTLVESNKRKHWSTYQIPSNATVERLRNMFADDWELFKNISGLHIDTVYMPK